MARKTTSRKKQSGRRKNTRKDAHAPFRRFKYAFLLLILVGAAALAQTIFSSKMAEIGKRIKTLETDISYAEKELRAAKLSWENHLRPDVITHALERHKLQMVWPKDDQVMVVRNHRSWVERHRQHSRRLAGMEPLPFDVDSDETVVVAR